MRTNDLADFFVLSCEHAGFEIPTEIKAHVLISQKVKESHRGWDRGAKSLALKIQKQINIPLYSFEICRLIIEGNRPLEDIGLFSKYSQNLTPELKEHLINKYHKLHWEKVKEAVKKKIAKHGYCLHIGAHTFTPVLNGVKRECDIGLLYDPKNKDEALFAKIAFKQLAELGFIIKMNYPYKGIEPGMTQSFRNELKNYAGIELEVNQKIVRSKTGDEKLKLIAQKVSIAIEEYRRIKNG